MLFTSLAFALFLVILFFLYWFVFAQNLKFQNIFLLFGSYFFYGWWDLRFLILLFSLSAVNYSLALLFQRHGYEQSRKILFIAGLLINIGTLVFFKYFNFFNDSFIHLISQMGFKISRITLNVILPAGISFYIFISISYLIDVYQQKLKPAGNIFEALLTFSFFPVILAGPIQRPIGLLPQIQKKRIFNYSFATDGLKQILWGLFMKMVIADNCVAYVDDAFSNFSGNSGSTLFIGIILFTIQIYADFAGYSNIAIGIGKLLGFRIMKNFEYPYFATDISAFWKKWNISLTTWFRDYVFLPVAYSVSRKLRADRYLWVKTDYLIYITGISVTWMLTGLWHGANYTFVIWGLIHGFFLVMHHLTAKPRKRLLKKVNLSGNNKLFVFIEWLFVMIVVMFSWIFFRADHVNHAFGYISRIFSSSFFTMPVTIPNNIIILIILFFGIEWLGQKHEYAIASLQAKWPGVFRWLFYYCIVFAVFYYSGAEQEFIYFQF